MTAPPPRPAAESPRQREAAPGTWLRRAPLLVAAVALVAGAAVVVLGLTGSATRTETGLVAAIEDRSLTQVDGFTLRTVAGQEVRFRIGRLELSGGAFPAGHLREHLALGQPVVVRYREENGERVAYRLEDAAPTGS